MDIQQEREGRGATRQSGRDVEEAVAPSKMRLIARYAMLGFAPLLSVVALTVAVVGVAGNRSDREQIRKVVASVDSQKSSIEAAENELDRLKLALAREKSLQEDEHQKQKELEAKIVQSISQLQAKVKISPTLEQQLQQAAITPVAAPAATGTD